MTIFKAAAVQATPVPGDTQATVDKVIGLVGTLASRKVDVAVFPEALIGGYPKGANFGVTVGSRTSEGREEFARYAEQAIAVPGPETEAIADAVKEANLFMTIGVIEKDGGTLYCSALYFSPDGYAGKHRKIMPTASERLVWGFGDGSTLETVETPWGPLGAVICWENYMPQMRMAMFGQGIRIYCAPTADDRDSWAATMRHIALEGRCFVISSCQYLTRADFPDSIANRLSDKDTDVLMRGGALIIDPLGRIVAGPDYSGETIVTADLDTDDVTRAQLDFDVVGHYARPDIFSLTVNNSPQRLVTMGK
jgi:nitrilase